jgi:S-adenosylmethionine-diacylgycerolhomoserine-N-methlytransferase
MQNTILDDLVAQSELQRERMDAYYSVHARIYEATRWTFLFGRKTLVETIKEHFVPSNQQLHLLEIGCGTGYNLKLLLRHFPNWRFTGLDISEQMIKIAKKAFTKDEVQLIQAAYGADRLLLKPNICYLSYCLTMVNPGYKNIIRQAHADLPVGGIIAVVDFHSTRFRWFAKWMRINHVRMEGQVVDALLPRFKTLHLEVKPAYFGLWHYIVFIGEK